MPTELELWEKKLKVILDEIDAALEAKFGALFHRKPVRPAPGVPQTRNMPVFLRFRPHIPPGSVHNTARAISWKSAG